MPEIKTQICVIGGGSGGLSVAAGASQMGADVVLIEANKMGGDCLNYGCVPSKALLSAGKRAQAMRTAEAFGIANANPQVDYAKVSQHVHGVIDHIAPHDSVERFESLGVNVILGKARFIAPDAVQVGDDVVKAKRFVIATGSHPVAPPIEGLSDVEFYTNETFFDLTEQPSKLIVIGGGPIGCEMAQAHLMLGTLVTVLEMFTIMPKDDAECVDVVRQKLLKQGLELHEQIKVQSVAKRGDDIVVTIEKDGATQEIIGSHLLVSAGRLPNIQDLDLEKAGVAYEKRGVKVDARLRSSNKKIFAIGDAAGSFQFTHAAGYHAGIVIRNALFHMPAKVSYAAMPWVTYTSPELAHVGLQETQAQQQNIAHTVLRFNADEVDRYVAERATDGFIKVIVSPKGVVLGATIVAQEAGELILPWVLAVQNKMKIGTMAGVIAPYPTRGDLTKRAAGQFYVPKLFSPRMRKIVRFLSKF